MIVIFVIRLFLDTIPWRSKVKPFNLKVIKGLGGNLVKFLAFDVNVC